MSEHNGALEYEDGQHDPPHVHPVAGDRIAYDLACPRCHAPFRFEVPVGSLGAYNLKVRGVALVSRMAAAALDKGEPIFMWCQCGADHGVKDGEGCGAYWQITYEGDS